MAPSVTITLTLAEGGELGCEICRQCSSSIGSGRLSGGAQRGRAEMKHPRG